MMERSVVAPGLYVGKQYEVEELFSELQLWLVREINKARWAQKRHNDEYFEGYADALGDVILKIEDLRKKLRRIGQPGGVGASMPDFGSGDRGSTPRRATTLKEAI